MRKRRALTFNPRSMVLNCRDRRPFNSFDQWGVELGKELATELLPVVSGKEGASGRDASTQGLVAHLHARRKA
ncbi:glucose-6-phosphate isomerase [Brucella ceti TE28753-12]|nr:glucose-6-phosphate isomerase [Brucella ceti]AHB02537.1 glucose-6-phosphate isomerase [Brucella ceti TE28753-12]